MDLLWELVGILAIPIVLWSAWVMVSRIRQRALLTAGGLMWPVGSGFVIVIVYVLLLDATLGSVRLWLPFASGAAVGWIWSRTATLGRAGSRVTCRRSAWTLLIWGLSFVPVQLLAVFEPDLFATVGVGLLFGASGLAIGEHLGLLIRRQRLSSAPSKERTPTTVVSSLREAGHLLLDAGLPGRARAVFDRLLEIEPGDQVGQMGVAECLLQQQQPRNAMEILQKLGGDEPAVWRLLALAALETGAGEVARSAFERHQELTAQPPDPLSMAVAAYFELDIDRCRNEVEAALAAQADRPEALAWERKLKSLDTRYAFLVDVAHAHLRRGNIHAGLGLLVGLGLLDEATAMGGSLQHQVLQGQALILAGRFEQALHHLQGSLGRYSDDRQLRSELGAVLLLTGRASEAAAELDRVLAGPGALHNALVRRAQVAVVTNDCEGAERWSAAARSSDPEDCEGWLVSAQAVGLARRDFDARLLVDHALVLCPVDPQLWAEGARLIRGRHPGLADHYTRRALALTGSDEVVQIKQQLERVEEELASLEGVIGGRSEFPNVCADRVTIYGELGLNERALTLQEAAWRGFPQLGEEQDFHISRGSLLAGIGALVGAEASFRQALWIAPDHQVARKAFATVKSLRESLVRLD